MWGWLQRLFRRQRLRADSAALSECGPVRAENQDHVMVRRGRLVFCVADGMGGGEGGAKASEIVCAAVARAAARRQAFPERVQGLHAALERANAEIRDYAAKAGFAKQMASTAAVLALDLVGGQAVAGFVGDTRIYRFRAGALQQLSRDHTVADELRQRASGRALAAGLGDRSLALAHVLTRAVGILPEAKSEWRRFDVLCGDVYLLCSDGVYDMVGEGGLAAALAAGGAAREMAARLAEKVVAGGAADNYSLVVVKVGPRGRKGGGR